MTKKAQKKILIHHITLFLAFLMLPLIVSVIFIAALFILPILLCFPGKASTWLLLMRYIILYCLFAPLQSIFGAKQHLCRACHQLSEYNSDCKEFDFSKREMICSDCVYNAEENYSDGIIEKF